MSSMHRRIVDRDIPPVNFPLRAGRFGILAHKVAGQRGSNAIQKERPILKAITLFALQNLHELSESRVFQYRLFL